MNEIKTIDGKHYKECNVVMLRTEKVNLNMFNHKLWLSQSKNWKQYLPLNTSGQGLPQHLYITSDEEIKEGDYGISTTNKIFNFRKELLPLLEDAMSAKKIIASTDSSLNLPRPSNDFINAYIKSYNEGKVIDNVLVRCGYTINKTKGHFNQFREYFIRVGLDNTINIKSSEETWDDIFTRVQKQNPDAHGELIVQLLYNELEKNYHSPKIKQ